MSLLFPLEISTNENCSEWESTGKWNNVLGHKCQTVFKWDSKWNHVKCRKCQTIGEIGKAFCLSASQIHWLPYCHLVHWTKPQWKLLVDFKLMKFQTGEVEKVCLQVRYIGFHIDISYIASHRGDIQTHLQLKGFLGKENLPNFHYFLFLHPHISILDTFKRSKYLYLKRPLSELSIRTIMEQFWGK